MLMQIVNANGKSRGHKTADAYERWFSVAMDWAWEAAPPFSV